jgi:hypothetical protein
MPNTRERTLGWEANTQERTLGRDAERDVIAAAGKPGFDDMTPTNRGPSTILCRWRNQPLPGFAAQR